MGKEKSGGEMEAEEERRREKTWADGLSRRLSSLDSFELRSRIGHQFLSPRHDRAFDKVLGRRCQGGYDVRIEQVDLRKLRRLQRAGLWHVRVPGASRKDHLPCASFPLEGNH